MKKSILALTLAAIATVDGHQAQSHHVEAPTQSKQQYEAPSYSKQQHVEAPSFSKQRYEAPAQSKQQHVEAPTYSKQQFRAPAQAKQRYEAPAQSKQQHYEAPAQSKQQHYEAPAQAKQRYEAPAQSKQQHYEAPTQAKQRYEAPAQSKQQHYEAPTQAKQRYEAPAQSKQQHYEAPTQSKQRYEAPAQSKQQHVEAPVQSKQRYEAPTQSKQRYEAPAQSKQQHYEAPTQAKQRYEAPAQSKQQHYEAPAQSKQQHYEAPTQSKQRYEAPAQSKQQHVEAPSQSKQRYEAPTQAKQQYEAPTQSKQQYEAPTQSKQQYEAPTQSKQQYEAPAQSKQQHVEAPSQSKQRYEAPAQAKHAEFAGDVNYMRSSHAGLGPQVYPDHSGGSHIDISHGQSVGEHLNPASQDASNWSGSAGQQNMGQPMQNQGLSESPSRWNHSTQGNLTQSQNTPNTANATQPTGQSSSAAAQAPKPIQQPKVEQMKSEKGKDIIKYKRAPAPTGAHASSAPTGAALDDALKAENGDLILTNDGKRLHMKDDKVLIDGLKPEDKKVSLIKTSSNSPLFSEDGDALVVENGVGIRKVKPEDNLQAQKLNQLLQNPNAPNDGYLRAQNGDLVLTKDGKKLKLNAAGQPTIENLSPTEKLVTPLKTDKGEPILSPTGEQLVFENGVGIRVKKSDENF